VPPDDYFQRATAHVRRDGALFIADEVQSGFGRTGKLFAIEHSGVEPDILCMAKGIADGFPLSAFTARADVAAAFTPGDHLSTFGGNPVSCAAALANLDVLRDEKLPENAALRGAQILRRLNAWREKCPAIGDVRGQGLMIGIELIADAQKTPAVEAARQARALAREHGLLIGVGGGGNVLRVQPPLILTAAEADRACDILEHVLAQVRG
jgi:4-aminobutyrate aminotransferase-like enzyme